MEELKELLGKLKPQLTRLLRKNAVVAKPISIGDRHVVTLVELGLSWGAGGGKGEGESEGEGPGKGVGGGSGGGARSAPVAVVIVDGDNIRLESLGL